MCCNIEEIKLDSVKIRDEVYFSNNPLREGAPDIASLVYSTKLDKIVVKTTDMYTIYIPMTSVDFFTETRKL